ncbi:PLP-dependent aminotransferase family protein [Pelosinus fermentans]|uniref:aminotransferase-like domain-containing protein n=1 Tax=Pelosinus fermentans TaxID=365349 RepID=UPI001ED97070|nr:PLP-dependent aminotransferase family protein [Pelosinus fermentans]
MSFANRVKLLKTAANQEILKFTQQPEVISFAVGMPAAEMFPIEELKHISNKVLEEAGNQALQYSTSEGFEPLRELVATRMNNKFKTNIRFKNIMITNGGQQALDFCAKLFINDGDTILCESPTYLAAINAFMPYCPNFVEVPTDDYGMIIEKLEEIIQITSNIKFIYIVPDFQNPTGRTWSLERRRQLMAIINKYEIHVIEDNPYGELRFEGDALPSLKSFDTKGLVIFISSFSKTFCPGLRIGWIAAEDIYFEKFVIIKQGADLHTSTINQMLIAKYMEMYDFDANLEKIINVYKRRRDVMINAIKVNFKKDIKFTYPQGGLFIWVELPYHIKAVELLERCLKDNVAFIPGDTFFPNSQVKNTLRLNFSNMSEEKIREGIWRIGKVLNEF